MLRLFKYPDNMSAMTEIVSAIADKVRGIAAEKRCTQQRVAYVLGLSRGSVSARWNGTVPFTAAELFKLSRELDVQVDRFFPSDLAA